MKQNKRCRIVLPSCVGNNPLSLNLLFCIWNRIMGNIEFDLKTKAKAFCCTKEDGAALSVRLNSKIHIPTYHLVHAQQRRHLKQPYL